MELAKEYSPYLWVSIKVSLENTNSLFSYSEHWSVFP